MIFIGILIWLYKNTTTVTYRVYEDHIESEGGWLTTSTQSVPVEDIVDVSYKQGKIPVLFDVGTVQISTAGEDGSAMSIAGVENSRELFEDIKRLAKDEDETPENFNVLNEPRGW